MLQLVMVTVVYQKWNNTMKARNEEMLKIAQRALIDNTDIWKEKPNSILDAYNGQIAALGVSVAISGLLPALVIYYQDKPKPGTPRKANRKIILDLISKMISLDDGINLRFDGSKTLIEYAMNNDLSELKKEVIECAIALKQVVRTYNLVPK